MTVMPDHDHTHPDAENHEHVGKFSYRHTHVMDPENKIHDQSLKTLTVLYLHNWFVININWV